MGPDRACDQPESSDEQYQHDERIEKGRRLEIDVHVGDHAGQNDERASQTQQSSDKASAVPKQNPDTDQHGQECDTESVCTVKAPVRADHTYLIRKEISADTGHGEADQEVAEAAGGPANVAQRMVRHAS